MESLLINTEDLMPIIMNYGQKILMALITLIIGSWIANKIIIVFKKLLIKRNVDESLAPFLSSLIGSLLKIMLYITVIGMIGIEMTS